MSNSKTLSVSVGRKPAEIYDFILDPENLPRWAPAFSQSAIKSGNEWKVESPDGLVTIRFVERNEFGVLDHWVTMPSGQVVLNPMRVIPNGDGSEVVFTLYQRPGMPDDKFEADAQMVASDLQTLKITLEG